MQGRRQRSLRAACGDKCLAYTLERQRCKQSHNICDTCFHQCVSGSILENTVARKKREKNNMRTFASKPNCAVRRFAKKREQRLESTYINISCKLGPCNGIHSFPSVNSFGTRRFTRQAAAVLRCITKPRGELFFSVIPPATMQV